MLVERNFFKIYLFYVAFYLFGLSFIRSSYPSDFQFLGLTNNASLDVLVEEYKSKGKIYDIYRLVNPQDIFNISSGISFICKLFDGKITTVYKKADKFEIDTNGKVFKFSLEEFLKKWNKEAIVGPILINTWCEQGEGDKVFYIIYSYHDEDFLKIKKAIGFIFDSFKNKKICYIDELGLIPYESVERQKKYENISEEQAFNEIKSVLRKELKRISKGYILYDPEPTYSKIYSYLARHKVECYMEDLQYENWKKIVQFDKLKVSKIAQLYFLNGDVNNYLKYKKTYIKGFWQLNVNIRDRNFAEQVVRLINDKPEKIFFTIRGIGHLGLIKKLTKRGIRVRYIILGEKDLQTSLINQQILQICYDLGIKLSTEDEMKLLLNAEIQELLRAYIGYFEKKNTLKSTIQANEIMMRLNENDVYSIFSKVYSFIKDKKVKIESMADIYKLVYDLVKRTISLKNKLEINHQK